jgi:hypothetical protein
MSFPVQGRKIGIANPALLTIPLASAFAASTVSLAVDGGAGTAAL